MDPRTEPQNWENVHDDASRAELMPYLADLVRLDSCGPAACQDPHVL